MTNSSNLTFKSKEGNTFEFSLHKPAHSNVVGFAVIPPEGYKDWVGKHVPRLNCYYVSSGYNIDFDGDLLDFDFEMFLKSFLRPNKSSTSFVSEEEEISEWRFTLNQSQFMVVEHLIKGTPDCYHFMVEHKDSIPIFTHECYKIPQDVRNVIVQTLKYKSFIG